MKVLIAGGGTGGHIYPAIAIAKALQELDSSTVVEFVGTPYGLETRLVPQAGFKIHTISVGRLNKNVSFFERLSTVFALPLALIKSFFLVKKYSPDAVVGVGGYASGPVVLVAALLGYRSFIWEPNAYPGLANRWLSRFVDKCLIVFNEAAKHMNNKNIIHVHMPVRKEIEDSSRVDTRANTMANNMAETRAKTSGLSSFQSSFRTFRILIFGGSQGARAINTTFVEAVLGGGSWLQNVEIVHQTGAVDFERISAMYATKSPKNVQVLEYLNDMPVRYAWADVVVSRAGTGTISELAAIGKAALLIPFPYAADDHQAKNAQALVQLGAARLLLQSELTTGRLIQEIEFLKNNPQAIRELEENIRRFHKPRAAYEIAKIVVNKGLQ